MALISNRGKGGKFEMGQDLSNGRFAFSANCANFNGVQFGFKL
jgi:hypothetical protein